MSSKQRQELQSEGGGDAFRPPVHLIRIAEEDPSHPEHEAHMARVSLEDPENVALLESMRLIGWPTGSIVYIYKDGDGYAAATARRRLTLAKLVNNEWKKAKDKRYPMRCHAVMTDDPDTARDIENAHRKEDPPLVRARRYVEKRAEYGWPNVKDAAAKAAACVGLRLDYANALAACLSLPADIRAKVNAGELPPDVAARVAKKEGAPGVAKVVEAAKGEDGKVNPAKARAAAKEMPKRPKAIKRDVGLAMADRLNAGHMIIGDIGENVAALVRYLLGDREQVNGRPWLLSLVKDAETAAKEWSKGSDDARQGAE